MSTSRERERDAALAKAARLARLAQLERQRREDARASEAALAAAAPVVGALVAAAASGVERARCMPRLAALRRRWPCAPADLADGARAAVSPARLHLHARAGLGRLCRGADVEPRDAPPALHLRLLPRGPTSPARRRPRRHVRCTQHASSLSKRPRIPRCSSSSEMEPHALPCQSGGDTAGSSHDPDSAPASRTRRVAPAPSPQMQYHPISPLRRAAGTLFLHPGVCLTTAQRAARRRVHVPQKFTLRTPRPASFTQAVI